MTGNASGVAKGAALLLVTLLYGCATLETSKQPPIQAKTLAAGELVARLMQRNEKLASLRSLARISYRVGQKKGGFQGAVVVGRPDRLRLEAFSMFGTALVVTVDADAVTGFHPSQNRFYRGASSKQNLFRYTQVLLDLEELTALLMGMPPVVANARWDVTQNFVQRRLADGSLDMVELASETGIPVRWERFRRTGERQFSAVFQQFVNTSVGPFPLKIAFVVPQLARLVEIRYDEPEINAALSDSLFVQSIPDTAVQVPLESLGG